MIEYASDLFKKVISIFRHKRQPEPLKLDYNAMIRKAIENASFKEKAKI